MNSEELSITGAELLTRLRAYYGPDAGEWVRAHLIPQLNRWLARGDGVAVYENHDLGHQDAGALHVTSFGSSRAQLEGGVPPQRMPDIGAIIGWRYALVATYRGGQLDENGEQDHERA